MTNFAQSMTARIFARWSVGNRSSNSQLAQTLSLLIQQCPMCPQMPPQSTRPYDRWRGLLSAPDPVTADRANSGERGFEATVMTLGCRRWRSQIVQAGHRPSQLTRRVDSRDAHEQWPSLRNTRSLPSVRILHGYRNYLATTRLKWIPEAKGVCRS